MMKRILFIAALLAALPWGALAQVEKRVEVTKAYEPSVGNALKLPLTPDMTDTVKMRPEIDYMITPLSLQTTLATRPIRPATVTYWEFNRPLPFYLKVGAGYPLNSVLDFYASTQNPGTGYVVGYVNHEGRYAKIGNNFGVKNNSTRMLNRIGAAAGKYFGRRTLEADLSYENRMYHRYGAFVSPDVVFSDVLDKPGSMLDYSDANVALRFGDDFQDLSRVNFEVALRGGMFFDHSERVAFENKARQTMLGGYAKIARGFGRHRFSAEVGYEWQAGQKLLDGYDQQLIHAALRYGIDGGVVRLEAGADYYHDKIEPVEAENYILPFLRLNFNLGTNGISPFLEIDGKVRENSFRSLTKQNPYLMSPGALPKSSVDYNVRLGLGGSLWRGRLDYRLYAGFSIRDNHIYWYNEGEYDATTQSALLSGTAMLPEQARQTVFSINGEVTWRPISRLRTELEVHGYAYNDDETKLHNGAPAFDGKLAVHYEAKKIAFGVGIYVQSVRKWSGSFYETDVTPDEDKIWISPYTTFEAPFTADLRVNFDWKVSGRVTLFAEGRNLLNRRLYHTPWYPEYGANFTVGVKMNF